MDRSVLYKYARRPWGFGRPRLPRRRKNERPSYTPLPGRRRGDRSSFRQELGGEVRQEAGERLQDSIQGALVGGAVEGFGGGAGSPRLPEPNVWEDERAFAQRVFTARLRDYHAAEQALLQRWRANNPAPTPQSVMAEIQEQLSDRFGRE